MAYTSLNNQPGRTGIPLKVRYRLTPWWVKVLVIFVASRIVTTTILLAFASIQGKNSWTGPHPGYFDFAGIWDGRWYYIITAVGYPSELPITNTGHIGENAWAFLPGFPAVVRVVMLITTLDYSIASVIVSVAFSLGTALMFYRLMHLRLPHETSLFAVVLLCFAPLSPILQVAYAESMAMFFLTVALYFLLQRRYWVMLPVIAAMSLTRPSGLAFALAMAMHVIYRLWVRRRDPFPLREAVAAIVVGLFSAFMGYVWVLVAWAFTGVPTAYTDTELAWRSAYIGYQQLLPFIPWIQAAGFWSPQSGIPLPLMYTLIGIIVALFFALLFTKWARRLGPDLRFWIASYGLYLLAVFFPQSSTFRLLMPMFPALGAFAQPKSVTYRVGLVLFFIVLQVGWVYIAWWVNGYDWTPP